MPFNGCCRSDDTESLENRLVLSHRTTKEFQEAYQVEGIEDEFPVDYIDDRVAMGKPVNRKQFDALGFDCIWCMEKPHTDR